jgi:hypothetical protein
MIFMMETMLYKVSDATVHDVGENVVQNMCDMQMKMQQDFF